MKKIFSILLVTFFIALSFQGKVFAANTDITVKEIQGLVQIQKAAESAWVKAEENLIVTSGDKVRSFLGSSALLVFPDGSEFRLRENTSLDIKDISQNEVNKTAKRELKLNLGSLHYKVPPKKEKATEFKIHSSTSIVGITGTEGVITAKGEGKPSENILIEGATYNTNDQGKDGRYQKSGNVYKNNGQFAQIFGADVEEEAKNRMAINREYVDLIKEAVASFKSKRDEGYRVGGAEALIKQAFFYLEKREYDLVGQTVEQINAVLGKAKKIKLPENLDDKIAEIAGALNDKEGEGYDVSRPFALLGKAQGQKQNGEFGSIKQILTQIEKDLAIVTEERRPYDNSGSFLSHYQDVQRKVLEKGQQGFATGENRALLREAEMFYEQGEKPRAYMFLKEAEDKLLLAMRSISDSFTEKIIRLESEIAVKKASLYMTKELELRLEKVKVYLKEENFLKARELVLAVEDGLVTLTKSISAEWQVKISDLKKNVNYKRSTGYSLGEIPGLIGEMENDQAQGDLTNLELTYAKVVEGLDKLALPAGFEADWKSFVNQEKAKRGQGYNFKEAGDLSAQIQASIDAGDIKSARSFLAQAKKTLSELKDQEPPKVQVISFTETEDTIKIEGYASDNTGVKSVSVNNSVVDLTKEGTFLFDTVPNPSVSKLSVSAIDAEGNVSAPVVLVINVKGKAIDSQAELKDVDLEYSQEGMVVQGKFVPGGKVKVGIIEAVCNDAGRFRVAIKPDRNKPSGSIAVAGIISDDITTDETVLTIEDKWMPRIEITKVSFDNNFVPAVNVDPLAYSEDKFSISGQVVLTQMANIEGRVFDLGGEIESLTVENTDVDIREDSVFNASLTFDRSRKNPSVTIAAKDKSGNTTETQVALDAVWSWPSLRINDTKIFQRSLGKFSKEIPLTADMSDIAIVLENNSGETIVSKHLPVAAVLSPELEIQDIRYEGAEIVISGRTTADGVVSDKNKTFFAEDAKVTKNTIFTLRGDYPPVDKEVVLVASNIEGKLSKEVTVIVGPPKDNKAPVLYLSSPQKEKKGIVIKGFIEDDSQIARLTVQGAQVEIADQGGFSYKIESAENLNSIEITASDIFNNETKKIIALNDKEKPQITIDRWEAKDGRLIISGTATDNIAIKQVQINSMPIAIGGGETLSFSYDGALTEISKDAVIVAVDLLNNETREGPRAISIPTDATAPQGKSISIKYGSPIIYASGEVADPAGVKAVYVNGEEVELFDDGTFDIKVSIDVGLPKITLGSPQYNNGTVIITGKVAAGDFSPATITVESEDLSGNRGVLFTQEVAPYQLNELEVAVNGQVVDVEDDGSFRYEQPIALGQRTVEIKTQDPFDNSLFENLDLEDKKPVLTLDPLEYNAAEEAVILSGKAQDEGSGLYTVSVNGIRTDTKNDGSFTYRTTFNQGSLNIVAADYVGNETSLAQEVSPPDIWPPVFSLRASPVPAIVGDSIYVEIAALDSKSRLPEILKNAPTVTADADGTLIVLSVAGEGASYMATLETAGLKASLITVKVQGEDEAGNLSSDTEGTNAFALVVDDKIVPSFMVETVPAPVILGAASTVKVFSSEDLKSIPSLEAVLPSGEAIALQLSRSGSNVYQASFMVPVDEGIGTAFLKLSGGEDFSGNVHEMTETPVVVAAAVTIAELPLNISSVAFVADRFTLSGVTASEAIVRLEAGKYFQDIVADVQGIFRFERPVSLAELTDMYTRGPRINVKLKAHNYAGFESRQKFFEVPLPPLPAQGGANFQIRLHPSPVGQGDLINMSVNVLKNLPKAPKGFLNLPGGRRVPIDLQGTSALSAQYTIPENTALGTATFEVVSDNIRESINFDVVLSDLWMQKLNKYDFFKIRVSKDPLITGEQAEFFVETMGDLPKPPRLEIKLPNGRVDTIVLTGSKRFFQGAYVSPADATPGRAELILNSGAPEEIRRPYGVEDRLGKGVSEAFLSVNPNPLISGKPYDINISFPQNVPFKPRLALKLQSGQIIEIPLTGAASSNKFTARASLPGDAVTGLAKFVLFDDKGIVLSQFPTQVSAPVATAVGTDIFIAPDVLRRMTTATVQVNSIISLYGRVEAQISFPDGTKQVITLEGTGTLRKGTFTVPQYAPLGMITISVYNEGKLLGTINTQVIDQGQTGGPIHIFLDKPDFKPFDFVKLNAEANWALSTIPKAELFWEGGSLKVTLTGQVPGNRFVGEFMAPRDPITRGRIEIRNEQGALLGDFPLDRGGAREGEVTLNPPQPVIGQPLSITVVAPAIVSSLPIIRLIFDDGSSRELNAIGRLPGDRFTASLALLEKALRRIEIVHEGKIVLSIPVEYLSASTFDFSVDIMDEMVVPCDITDIIVRSNSYVPFTPYMSVDFNGRIVNVPLSKISPTEFLGRINVPCDVNFNNYNMRIFDPQGKLLWQRSFAADTATAGLLTLLVMPVDAVSVELSWNMISGIDGYEIRYGETAALGRTAFAGNVSRYTISNLITGQVHFFKVAARKNGQDIMVSDIINVIIGGTTLELAVNHNVTDNDVNLTWAAYPGADRYRVLWGTAIGAYPNSAETTVTNYFINDLTMGGNYYVKVVALQNGQTIGESSNIFIHIEDFVSSGGNISLIPDPPIIGGSLLVRINLPQQLPFTPRLIIQFASGVREYNYNQPPYQYMYEWAIPVADMNSLIMYMKVVDPNTGVMISDRTFSGGQGPVSCVIMLSYDPPQIGQSLTVTAQFPEPVSTVPSISVVYDNRTQNYTFPQGAGLSTYVLTIPVADMNSHVNEIKIRNYPDNLVMCERFFGDGAPVFVQFISANPNPPVVGQNLQLHVEFNVNLGFGPRWKINMVNGFIEGNFAQGSGYRIYDQVIQGGLITSMPMEVEIWDDQGQFMPDGQLNFNTDGSNLFVNLYVSPNPPIPGTDLLVMANFNTNVPFIPGLSIDLSDATSNEYVFPGAAGAMSYQRIIPGNDLTAFVDRVVVRDNYGSEIMDDLVFGGQSAVEYPPNLGVQTTGVNGQLRVTWNSVSGVGGYKVYYGTSSRNYTNSNIVPGQQITEYIISNLLDNTLYFMTVQAYIGSIESNNPNEVSSYPGTGGGGGTLSASPMTLNVSGHAGENITQRSVSISNNGTAAVTVRVQRNNLVSSGDVIASSNLMISPTSAYIAPFSAGNFAIDLNIPSGKPDGLYTGPIKFYADQNGNFVHDAGEAFVDATFSLTISNIDHIRISSDADSSTMGDPIFVTLRAEDSNNNIVQSYSTDVTINVSESAGGAIHESWILSTNDGPGGSYSSTVEMFDGIGNFTVDAQEPETLNIAVVGGATVGGPLNLTFTPAAGSTAVSFAIIGPSTAPTGTDGATIWVAAVDASGQVVTGYTGTLDLTASGDGPNSQSLSVSSHTFAVGDYGQFQVMVSDINAETVTITAQDNPVTFSPTNSVIDFIGVTKYLVYDGASHNTTFTTQGTTQRFTLRAADASDNTVRSYNETATFTRTSDPTNNAYLTQGNSVEFIDGIAEITLNNSEAPETVEFIVDENNDPAIDTSAILVNFTSSDASAPEIVRVEMDTPWIVHIYFNEDVQSGTGGSENNYNVGGGFGATIDKVCWYGDNVTLNLSSIPGGGLGSTFNLIVNGVTDSVGNAMSNVNYNNIAVPNVDYQGAAGATNDWFEIQVSDTTPSNGDTVHVTVYHKNVCGYLTGSNQANANNTVGSASVNYGGSLGIGGLAAGTPTSVNVSSGRGDFDITINGTYGGTITISASDGPVSTSQVVTLTIQ